MNLARKASVVVVGRVITTIIDLATAIIIVRLLSKTDFAIVSYLLLVYQMCRYLATLGFPDSIFYFFERISPNTKRAFAGQTFVILAIASAFAATIIFAMRWWAPLALSESWSSEEIELVQTLAPWLGVAAFLEIPTWPVANILLALERQKSAAVYELATSTLTFTGLIGPLLLGFPMEWSIYGLVAYAAVRCIGSCLWMMAVLPNSRAKLPSSLLFEQLKFSSALGLSVILSRLNKLADKFVVSAILPATALANYSVGAQEIPIVTVIPYAVGSVLMSRYVRLARDNRKKELVNLWYAAIRNTTLVVVPAGVFFIFFAREFIIAIFGPSYLEAILPFQIYTVIVLHRVTSYFGLIQSFGDVRSVVLISASILAANVVLSIPMTWWWGIVGTALATVFANLMGWMFILRTLGRHMGVSRIEVIPFPYYFRVLSIAALSGTATSLLIASGESEENSGLALVVAALIYSVMFIGLASLIGVIRSEDRERFLGVLGWKGKS